MEELFSWWNQPEDCVLGIFYWIFLFFIEFFWYIVYLRIGIIALLKIKSFFKVLNAVQQTHDKCFFGKWYLKCA